MVLYLAFELFLSIILSAIQYPLPLNDYQTVRYRTIPWVTILLIFVNSMVFGVWQAPRLYAMPRMIAALDPSIRSFDDPQFVSTFDRALNDYYAGAVDVYTYGYRSTTIQQNVSIGAFVAFTSMFMHGSFSHLVGNMLYLWAFGRRLEDACGSWRFLLFYLSCGMIAGIGSSIVKSQGIDVPSVGASGAIAGVLGGFLLLFPGARISCLWGIGLVLRTIYWGLAQIFGFSKVEWTWTVRLPAFLLLGAFAISSILASSQVLQGGSGGGVDHMAHLTGFLGALIIFFFVRKDLLARYFSGRSV